MQRKRTFLTGRRAMILAVLAGGIIGGCALNGVIPETARAWQSFDARSDQGANVAAFNWLAGRIKFEHAVAVDAGGYFNSTGWLTPPCYRESSGALCTPVFNVVPGTKSKVLGATTDARVNVQTRLWRTNSLGYTIGYPRFCNTNASPLIKKRSDGTYVVLPTPGTLVPLPSTLNNGFVSCTGAV